MIPNLRLSPLNLRPHMNPTRTPSNAERISPRMTIRPTLLAAALLTATALAQPYKTTPIQITADLSEGPRKLYHAEVDIPVTPGPITLTTPKWIPGNHRPTGPVDEITGVVFTAAGPGGQKQTLPWRRDDVNLYQFHVTVPQGVTTLHAHLDCIVTARVSQKMAVLEWEKLLLYPTGLPVRDIQVQPTVIVPAGWGVGTALTPLGEATTATTSAMPGSSTRYAATTVEQLQDSPVITGQYFHEFPLAPDVTPKHYIDVVSDQPEDSNLRPQLLAELNNLVHETGAAYNSRHYNVYHFLLTLSDVAGGEGLEHGQSSDNGVGEKAFSDATRQIPEADLLPHEFTHSWNGKYRRPARLYQPDFFQPEQGDLLWVYEGMTQYMGNVLAARSGLKTQAQYRDILAASAANLDSKPGRIWRNTEDTAIAASVLRGGDPAWANWKRGQDYYQEGELLWLDADTTIRKLTDNKKSLTDFHHIFLGKGGNTGPLIVTYEFKDLVHDLNEVVPYDWDTFLRTRITTLAPHADLAGIEQGGYRLVYLDHPSATERMPNAARGGRNAGPNVWYSLGLRVNMEGAISDVRVFGPADKAKLAPGSKIIAVNGQVFTADKLKAAVAAAKGKTEPIHLIIQSDTFVSLVDIPYFEGEKYPSLQRVAGTPDYLDDITKPLTTPDPASLPPAHADNDQAGS
jgi:predicted metalloprotease with PDZ domain